MGKSVVPPLSAVSVAREMASELKCNQMGPCQDGSEATSCHVSFGAGEVLCAFTAQGWSARTGRLSDPSVEPRSGLLPWALSPVLYISPKAKSPLCNSISSVGQRCLPLARFTEPQPSVTDTPPWLEHVPCFPFPSLLSRPGQSHR